MEKARLGRNYLLSLPIKEAASPLSRCQTLAALRTKRMFVICTRDIVPLCLEFDILDWIFRAARVYSLEMDSRFGKLIDRFDARLASETDTSMTRGIQICSRICRSQVSNSQVENSGISIDNFAIILLINSSR